MAISRNGLGGIALVCAATLLTTLASAQDEKALERAIEARQGMMNVHAIEAGPLFAMAKGDLPYDAAAAEEHATALRALLNYDETRLFPKGSSNAEMADETRALPAIWEQPDKFHEAFQNLRSAVDALATEAGKGQEALVAAVGRVGDACGNCHESFRQKQ